VVGLASLSETMAGTPIGGGACAEAKRACFISPSPFRRGAFLEQGGCTMKPLMHASSITGQLRNIDRGLISDRQKQQQQQQRRGRRASGAVAGYGYGGPIALRASASQSVEDEAKKEPVPFTLRRARKFEIDTLAALSTEAFTPRGAWYQVLQRVKFLLIVWDLQAQLYQRFTHVSSRLFLVEFSSLGPLVWEMDSKQLPPSLTTFPLPLWQCRVYYVTKSPPSRSGLIASQASSLPSPRAAMPCWLPPSRMDEQLG
jgi:hypothetical protein